MNIDKESILILQTIFSEKLKVDIHISFDENTKKIYAYYGDDLVAENESILSIIVNEILDNNVLLSSKYIDTVNKIGEYYGVTNVFENLLNKRYLPLIRDTNSANSLSLMEFVEDMDNDCLTIFDEKNGFLLVIDVGDFFTSKNIYRKKLLYFVLDNLSIKKVISDDYLEIDIEDFSEKFIDDGINQKAFIDDLQNSIMNNDDKYCEEVIDFYGLNNYM